MKSSRALRLCSILAASTLLPTSAFGQAICLSPKTPKDIAPATKEVVDPKQPPLPLEKTLELTYMQNAELDAARAGLRSTVEILSQATGDWRPSLSIAASQANEMHYALPHQNVPRGFIDWQEYRTEYTANLSQNIFKGGATISGVAQAESNVSAGKAGLFAKEQEVLLGAIQAHTSIVANAAILINQQSRQAFSRKRLEYAEARYEVGEGGRTDVAIATAEFNQASADVALAEGNLRVSEANYLYQVGSLPGTLKPANLILDVPKTCDDVIDAALAHNPSIIEAKYTLEAAEAYVDIQIAGLLPTVDVKGGVGNDVRGGTRLPSPFNDPAQTNLSVRADVNIPIYLQGIPNSKVRQAYQLVAQQKVNLVNTQRKIIEQSKSSWANFIASQESLKSLIAQVKALELTVEGIVEEYKVGLKSIVDVFVERDKLTEAQNRLAQAQQKLVVATYGVLQAMGRLTACDLRLKVKYYNPDVYYNEYKEAWIQFWKGKDWKYVNEVGPR